MRLVTLLPIYPPTTMVSSENAAVARLVAPGGAFWATLGPLHLTTMTSRGEPPNTQAQPKTLT